MTHDFLFKTQRLGFRLLDQEEMEYLEKMDNHAKAQEFFPSHLQNVEQFAAKINEFISQYKNKDKNKGLPCFAIYEIQTEHFAGACGFVAMDTGEIEVGYVFHKDLWGNGFSSETLGALIQWAKQNLTVDYIVGYTVAEHLAAQRIMEKCGMKHYKTDHVDGIEYRFYRVKLGD